MYRDYDFITFTEQNSSSNITFDLRLDVKLCYTTTCGLDTPPYMTIDQRS